MTDCNLCAHNYLAAYNCLNHYSLLPLNDVFKLTPSNSKKFKNHAHSFKGLDNLALLKELVRMMRDYPAFQRMYNEYQLQVEEYERTYGLWTEHVNLSIHPHSSQHQQQFLSRKFVSDLKDACFMTDSSWTCTLYVVLNVNNSREFFIEFDFLLIVIFVFSINLVMLWLLW